MSFSATIAAVAAQSLLPFFTKSRAALSLSINIAAIKAQSLQPIVAKPQAALSLLTMIALLGNTAQPSRQTTEAETTPEAVMEVLDVIPDAGIAQNQPPPLITEAVEDTAQSDTSEDPFATRILKYMRAKGYKIFTGARNYNIVYIEGINQDGTLNDDRPNVFNDLRIVIEVIDGTPRIVGIWEATTEPGHYHTYNPMNPSGAARIKLGQYTAWVLGPHGYSNPHEALVQVDNLTVHRDANFDFKRTNDREFTGWGFGINQHWGYDNDRDNIGRASAGCLVGRTRKGHIAFMGLVTNDVRYKANPNFMFTSTIIDGSDLNTMFN